jgi:hypothetical protein
MRSLVLGVIGLFVLAACGGGSTATASPAPISFAMGVQNASGVSGTGQVVKGSGSFTVTIKLTGLVPNSSHVSHIHNGACAKPGGIAYALAEVVADSSGAATATTTVSVDYTIPGAGWYVNVHHGPDLTAPANGPSITCGDLPTA